MKILVLSDSHSALRFMRQCIDRVKPHAVIHLGDYFDDGEAMKEEYPLEMENGRIKRGYLSLTPVFDDTSYQIFIKIK